MGTLYFNAELMIMKEEDGGGMKIFPPYFYLM